MNYARKSVYSYDYRRSPDQAASAAVRRPVVVVGAGPVGLALAIDLAQRDVPVVLLDDADRIGEGSRGICWSKRTLEILDRLGIGERLVAHGVTWKLGKVFYGDELLFYRGDLHGALNSGNQPRLDAALKHVQELADLCHQQGLQFDLIVPPVKSYLYYDWVDRPFYPDSKLLEALQGHAAGYVDLKQRFHRELEAGYQDLYLPDDSHWTYPAAEMAAEELTKGEAAP